MKQSIIILIIAFSITKHISAQINYPKISDQPGNINYCSAKQAGDSLVIENSRIKRVYRWNNGNLITSAIRNKFNGKQWRTTASKPDMSFPGQSANTTYAKFSVALIPESNVKPEHLEATVSCRSGQLEIMRVFRIYPDCPAVACDVYLRGQVEISWVQLATNPADLQNLEKLTEAASPEKVPVLEKLELPGKHWQLKTVEFFDVTDRNNTLVRETDALSYRENIFRGNLLFATDLATKNGIFILKESPTSNVQLAYPGSDFVCNFGNLRMIGAGVNQTDLDLQEWKKAYGFVTGVFAGDEESKLQALRKYQENVRIHKLQRDEMIMMNTWGDRGQDTRVNEAFCLAELDAGAKLGITHFQLDDGWQSGRSANSAYVGGSFDNIWRNPDYWKPNPAKFPNGLAPIVEKGKKLGIEICLWFNPSYDEGNSNWEKDADALIALNKQYGIRTFKIDGVKMPDKKSEINFRKLLNKVVEATNGEVVFNLDVTAGRRGGYHSFNEYGNIFLENRYTDWQNYYPYWTLRNLWMLSRYVPAQNLQIEFLNKWRNQAKYADDPFAPANYSFDYLFAITMAAQPLAWFEGTGLPADAFTVFELIGKYKKVMSDFHSGVILPIGQEPSGTGWTGFQSQKEQASEGYLLVFREMNQQRSYEFSLPMLQPGKYRFELILGEGKSFNPSVNKDGTLRIVLDRANSFALFRYKLIN
jgi:hypothetical protein